MKVGFVENLKKLTLTTIQHIQERQRLSKIKKSVNKEERNWKMKTVFWNNMSKKLMTYTKYLMQFTLWVEQLERDQQLNKEREMENKECWRLKNLIKDVEGTIALSLNEMHRRKVNFMRSSRKGKVCQQQTQIGKAICQPNFQIYFLNLFRLYIQFCMQLIIY